MRVKLRSMLLGAVALVSASSAFAAPDYDKPVINFSCVFGDCATDLSPQLRLEVIGDKNGEDPNVYFKFFNEAGVQSAVTQISFQDLSGLTFLHGVAGSIPGRGTGPGTEFQLSFHGAGGTDADALLTGGSFDASWTIRSVGAGAGGNGGIANGISGSTEWFELIATDPHPNYLAFYDAIQIGAIRVGVVAEGFANGNSATYLSNVVPEPETYAMLIAGLMAVGLMVHRRKL